MDKDTVNQDGNLIGRLGALAVIVVAVVGLGRVCGVNVCPVAAMGASCPLSPLESPKK
jgi:hypothetical protein